MRLFDLNCRWAWQYAFETTEYEAATYTDVKERLAQLDGYLTTVSATILTCSRRPADWASRADRWATLGEMIARAEAEFSGRLLIGSADFTRWRLEPDDGLCWGVLGLDGLDSLVRETADVDQLDRCWERGVRFYQLVGADEHRLAGSADQDEDHSLTDLGRAVLNHLGSLAAAAADPGQTLIIDLAGLNPRSMTDVFDWHESTSDGAGRIRWLWSRGLREASLADGNPVRVAVERLRERGGLIGLGVGPDLISAPDDLRRLIDSLATVPFQGRPGYEGIGIGTGYLDFDGTVSGLENAPKVARWLKKTFPSEVAPALANLNAASLLAEA